MAAHRSSQRRAQLLASLTDVSFARFEMSQLTGHRLLLEYPFVEGELNEFRARLEIQLLHHSILVKGHGSRA